MPFTVTAALCAGPVPQVSPQHRVYLLDARELDAVLNLRVLRTQTVHSRPRSLDPDPLAEEDRGTLVTRLLGEELGADEPAPLKASSDKDRDRDREGGGDRGEALSRRLCTLERASDRALDRRRQLLSASAMRGSLAASAKRVLGVRAGGSLGRAPDPLPVELVVDAARRSDARRAVCSVEEEACSLQTLVIRLASGQHSPSARPPAALPSPPAQSSRPSASRPRPRCGGNVRAPSEGAALSRTSREAAAQREQLQQLADASSVELSRSRRAHVFCNVEAARSGGNDEKLESIRDARMVALLRRTKLRAVRAAVRREARRLQERVRAGEERLAGACATVDRVICTWLRFDESQRRLALRTDALFSLAGLGRPAYPQRQRMPGEREGEGAHALRVRVQRVSRLAGADWFVSMCAALAGAPSLPPPLAGAPSTAAFTLLCALKSCVCAGLALDERAVCRLVDAAMPAPSDFDSSSALACVRSLLARFGASLDEYLERRGLTPRAEGEAAEGEAAQEGARDDAGPGGTERSTRWLSTQ